MLCVTGKQRMMSSVQLGFEYPQEQGHTASPGSVFQCSTNLTVHFNLRKNVCSFCLWPLLCSHRHSGVTNLNVWIRLPEHSFSTEDTHSLSSYERYFCSSAPSSFVWVIPALGTVHVLLVLKTTGLEWSPPDEVLTRLSKGRLTSVSLITIFVSGIFLSGWESCLKHAVIKHKVGRTFCSQCLLSMGVTEYTWKHPATFVWCPVSQDVPTCLLDTVYVNAIRASVKHSGKAVICCSLY